jgi:hypothetical protein
MCTGRKGAYPAIITTSHVHAVDYREKCDNGEGREINE